MEYFPQIRISKNCGTHISQPYVLPINLLTEAGICIFLHSAIGLTSSLYSFDAAEERCDILFQTWYRREAGGLLSSSMSSQIEALKEESNCNVRNHPAVQPALPQFRGSRTTGHSDLNFTCDILAFGTCLTSLTAFAVVWPNLITAQIPGCLDVTSLLVLRSFFSSPSYFGIGC
jgi:hypothetical protein